MKKKAQASKESLEENSGTYLSNTLHQNVSYLTLTSDHKTKSEKPYHLLYNYPKQVTNLVIKFCHGHQSYLNSHSLEHYNYKPQSLTSFLITLSKQSNWFCPFPQSTNHLLREKHEEKSSTCHKHFLQMNMEKSNLWKEDQRKNKSVSYIII